MRKGLTEIVLVLDRSGSMHAIKEDAEGGLRAFVETQRKAPGEARLTFYRFDDIIELVFEDHDIRWVENSQLRLEPRGSTALLDAMGRAIDEVGARLASRREEDRPEHVIFVTVTDGEENASRQFVATEGDKTFYRDYNFHPLYGQLQVQWKPTSKRAIFDMIKTQREQYNWQFIFIGCTQESLKMAESLGYNPNLVLNNSFSGRSYAATYQAMGQNLTSMRSGGGAQSLSFTAQQRSDVLDKDDTTIKSR